MAYLDDRAEWNGCLVMLNGSIAQWTNFFGCAVHNRRLAQECLWTLSVSVILVDTVYCHVLVLVSVCVSALAECSRRCVAWCCFYRRKIWYTSDLVYKSYISNASKTSDCRSELLFAFLSCANHCQCIYWTCVGQTDRCQSYYLCQQLLSFPL